MSNKEIRSEKITFRLTPKEKELIKQYAAAHNMTLTEVTRHLCTQIFNDKGND